MKKGFLLLFVTYVLALFVNFMPSIKYPDGTIGVLHVAATVLFLGALLFVLVKLANHSGTSMKRMKVLFAVGVLSGLAVYGIHILESSGVNNAVLDIMLSVQYPLYVLFITPLFGLNVIMNADYGVFSVIMSVVYMLAFISTMRLKKAPVGSV
ncbi:hypothetical protein [Sporosarcina sp. ITBMC105]